MKLENISITSSPDNEDFIRLSGEVSYGDLPDSPEVYWFDYPFNYEKYISNSGNPWLVCLLPLAVHLGEPLEICASVDRSLYNGCLELMNLWKRWYSQLKPISLKVEISDTSNKITTDTSEDVAAFFTGGIDSFFTLLSHVSATVVQTTPQPEHPVISDLISIWGLDIPLEKPDAFVKRSVMCNKVAEHYGKSFIPVATNIRKTRFNLASWGKLTHGCALACVAMALENKLKATYIASSSGYVNLDPWGSHPLVEPLLSTSTLRIYHDGAHMSRFEKTEFIAQDDLALNSIHVCWLTESEENCGNCIKCFRTMLALGALGKLEKCKCFPKEFANLKTFSHVYQRKIKERLYFEDIRKAAEENNRDDILKLIQTSNRFTKIMRTLEGLSKIPVAGIPLKPLTSFLLRKSIH